MSYYKTVLKEKGKRIEKEKRKKRIEELKRKTRRFSLEIFPRREILELLMSQGSIPKDSFRLLPHPLKRKFQTSAKELEYNGYIVEEKTDNGIVYLLVKKGNEESLAKIFTDEEFAYYDTFVSQLDSSCERKFLTDHSPSAKTAKGALIRTNSTRAYKSSLMRSVAFFSGIQATINSRGILHFQKETIDKSSPKYYSRFEILNDIKSQKYDYLYDKETDMVRHVFTGNVRNVGLLVSEGGIYSCYCPNKTLLRWYHESELIHQKFLKMYCDYRFANGKVESLHFVSTNNVILRILENDAREKIMRNLLHVDGLREKVMYALPLNENGVWHLKEMMVHNWQNRSHRYVGITYEENVRANNSSIVCDAVREIDGKEMFILNYCVPDLVKLKSFAKSCKNARNAEKLFGVYCYPYQTELIAKYIGDLCKIYEVEQIENTYKKRPNNNEKKGE